MLNAYVVYIYIVYSQFTSYTYVCYVCMSVNYPATKLLVIYTVAIASTIRLRLEVSKT